MCNWYEYGSQQRPYHYRKRLQMHRVPIRLLSNIECNRLQKSQELEVCKIFELQSTQTIVASLK